MATISCSDKIFEAISALNVKINNDPYPFQVKTEIYPPNPAAIL
jgi:hypothetical protein